MQCTDRLRSLGRSMNITSPDSCSRPKCNSWAAAIRPTVCGSCAKACAPPFFDWTRALVSLSSAAHSSRHSATQSGRRHLP